MTKTDKEKVAWSGVLTAVQPRIRLLRSLSERSHTYLGYVLRIDGTCGSDAGEFLIAVGKGAHEKHRFQTGMTVSGMSVPVEDPRLETAGFYKTSGVIVVREAGAVPASAPPYHGVPPDLETYRGRGHRRLDAKTYESKCTPCIWGCMMPVEIILDQWDQSKKEYRFEAFCYGPKSCSLWRAGPVRKVRGRRGMVYEEEDWVDEQATAHRGPDE